MSKLLNSNDLEHCTNNIASNGCSFTIVAPTPDGGTPEILTPAFKGDGECRVEHLTSDLSARRPELLFSRRLVRAFKMHWLSVLVSVCLSVVVLAGAPAASEQKPFIHVVNDVETPMQNIVTWDHKSLFVHGKRIMFYSGEFHPFRLPVPSLWLDVFQKIRSMGYTGVSFYVDWALLEGQPGKYNDSGVFDLTPFFAAAKKAGIYLLARPGPYINAEVSGGGFPGWTNRIPGHLRTSSADFLAATDLYMSRIGALIAAHQITRGGPVILVQPENEYTGPAAPNVTFPDAPYMNAVYKQLRDSGIVVPLISNDASNSGGNAPGTAAPVDIYGHDGYPFGFDCAHPDTWKNRVPTDWRKVHLRQSPKTPYSVVEFQGGAFDPWGGAGFDKCTKYVGPSFERVFYKNLYGFQTTVLNIYMVFGGTNWGNLGHPGGYTSYDYGASIKENRAVDREKYHEAKLQANFIVASPEYLLVEPSEAFVNGDAYTTSKHLAVTPMGNSSTGTRHQDMRSNDNQVNYKLRIGNLTVPQDGSYLSLKARDSKMLAFNYMVGNIKLLYSTAEIFTRQTYANGKSILIIYADEGDSNEIAFQGTFNTTSRGGRWLTSKHVDNQTIFNWQSDSGFWDRTLHLDKVKVHLVSRESAYKMWVLPISQGPSTDTPYTGEVVESAVILGGYLMRTFSVKDGIVSITGDLDNEEDDLQILGGAPDIVNDVLFNGERVEDYYHEGDVLIVKLSMPTHNIDIPNLTNTTWRAIDSLPEIQSTYDDTKWTVAGLNKTYNTAYKQGTPTSLFASDYGFHSGTILFRGHFTATGNESSFSLTTRGGEAYGASVYLDATYLGSVPGRGSQQNATSSHSLPKLEPGSNHVFTILIDSMGHDENWNIGFDQSKAPIGILSYTLLGRDSSAITWKIQGNHLGEAAPDIVRGPINEGGLWAERQGYHLPSAPTTQWNSSSGPGSEEIPAGSIRFYSTSVDLDIPRGLDIPLSLVIGGTSAPLENAAGRSRYRMTLWVNGWQFGRYVNNIGPQTAFPVPEGIWDYHGKNTVVVAVWNMDSEEVRPATVRIVRDMWMVWSGMEPVKTVESPEWTERNAY
ncbi:hypothetical protein BT63DRAFT_433432 [Microthyrium microscopicum]|uniref:Beta-galactosidase n=1 Tax=Microthyrium microscopicum TaxID=703497 RepID=A0A6A6U6I3_9PEZI|nr:hypothetical protein BT63DRAFT_433432 [Microthyrium microscopicum]